MPIEFQLIRASEFVCLDADDYLDLEASKKALQTLAQACRKRGLDRALLDLRSLPVLAKPHFTPKELAALVVTFCKAGLSRHHRLAVLYRHDVHGGIRSFAFIGRMWGLQVQAFTEFEVAMHWLSEEPRGRLERREQGVAIPITKGRGKTKRLSVDSPVAELHVRTSRTVRGTTKNPA